MRIPLYQVDAVISRVVQRQSGGGPKVRIGFRLAADVVAGIRATGRGYNRRVEKVLREALAKGALSD